MRDRKARVRERCAAGLPSRNSHCYRFSTFITAAAALVPPIAMTLPKRISLLFVFALATLTSAAHAQMPFSSDFALPYDMPPHEASLPHGPGFAVMNDLEHLQRLYDMSGRDAEMNAVYHDVLSKTHDPMLRHYVYVALARSQLKPANVDQAIVTIRKSLDEDLDALGKQPALAAAPAKR
jgi:hypothetical protein